MTVMTELPAAAPENHRLKIAVYGCNEGEAGFGHVILNLLNALGKVTPNLVVITHNQQIPDIGKLDPAIRRVVTGSGGGVRRARLLAEVLRKERPDVILCEANREKASRILWGAQWLAQDRAPVVMRLGVPVSRIMEQRNWLNRRLYLLSVRQTFARAAAVIANAQGVADDLVDHGGVASGKIRVIANSTVSAALQAMAQEEISDAWLQDRTVPVIVAAGRLRKQKDFPTLLRAFARVRQARHCRLLILGEGSERAPLERLVAELGVGDDVRLPGHCSNPFAWMRRCALFVLSSRFEGSPNVLIEALALGLPVVATDCHSGPRDILNNGEFGPLVPVGDEQALASAIQATLERPLPADVLKSSVAAYDADAVAAQYLSIMQSLTPL